MLTTNPKTLLIIDDEAHILSALKRLFKPCGYNVFTAATGSNALQQLEVESIAVILCDMRMPNMNGAEFLSEASNRSPQSIRILLTGQADMDDTIEVINRGGIFKYISKPWDNQELISAVDSAFELYQKKLTEKVNVIQTQEQNQQLERSNSKLQQEIQLKHHKLEKTTDRLASAYEGERKLRQAKNEAQRLSEEKSRFLATMSHEIRSPLNAVIAMNALLLESKLTDEQKELVNLAHNGGLSLLALINDILDFSKIESGQLKLNQQWFNLIETVETVAELIACQTINKPVEIQNIIDPNIASFYFGDETRIKQILINIISNAIKFTEQGGVLIEVNKTDDGINLRVIDSGIGISEENKEKIFGEFIQVDHGETRNYGGTGLGLSICKQLITIMGGNITVTDNEFGGSTFILNLPIKNKDTFTYKKTNTSTRHLIYFETENHILFEGIKRQLKHFNFDTYSLENLPTDWSPYNAFTHIVDVIDSAKTHADYTLNFEEKLKKTGSPGAEKHWLRIGFISHDGINKIHALNLKGFSSVLRKPTRLSNVLSAMNLVDDLLGFEPENTKSRSHREYNAINYSTNSHVLGEPENMPLRILLVEDSLANQAVIKAVLLKDAHTIDIANNGLEAVQKTQTTSYQLILMDISMPVMDGIEATKKIRGNGNRNKKTTIIAMTAKAFAEDREACLAAGMNDYISKPIDIQLFKNRVNYWAQQFAPITEKPILPSAPLLEQSLPNSANDRIKTRNIICVNTLEQLAKDTSWEVLPDILDVYFNETEKRIPKIISAYNNKDWAVFGDEVHTLKSSSGTFGAKHLFQLAIDFEDAIENGTVEIMQSEILSLQEIYALTVTQLNDVINNKQVTGN